MVRNNVPLYSWNFTGRKLENKSIVKEWALHRNRWSSLKSSESTWLYRWHIACQFAVPIGRGSVLQDFWPYTTFSKRWPYCIVSLLWYDLTRRRRREVEKGALWSKYDRFLRLNQLKFNANLKLVFLLGAMYYKYDERRKRPHCRCF